MISDVSVYRCSYARLKKTLLQECHRTIITCLSILTGYLQTKYLLSIPAKDQYELLANRTARVIEANEELRKQNLQFSQKIDDQDKALLRLRRDKLLHLLREQDFLDLKQSVTLAKEMGCA